MANASALNPETRRRTLVDLLTIRGLTPERAAAEVARMSDDVVIADLDFHLREDAASKRGAALPTQELIAHYTGPIHHMDLQTTETAIRSGGARRPASEADDSGPILTPRTVALGAAGLGCFFTLTYLIVRASRTRRASTTGES